MQPRLALTVKEFSASGFRDTPALIHPSVSLSVCVSPALHTTGLDPESTAIASELVTKLSVFFQELD